MPLYSSIKDNDLFFTARASNDIAACDLCKLSYKLTHCTRCSWYKNSLSFLWRTYFVKPNIGSETGNTCYEQTKESLLLIYEFWQSVRGSKVFETLKEKKTHVFNQTKHKQSSTLLNFTTWLWTTHQWSNDNLWCLMSTLIYIKKEIKHCEARLHFYCSNITKRRKAYYNAYQEVQCRKIMEHPCGGS